MRRQCLVYNLVLKKKEKIQVQQLSGAVNQLAAILKVIVEDKDIPKIILLGHQYTPSNFTMDSLKLHDRARAEALLRAAEQAGFYAKPGLVISYQTGELIDDYESRSYSSRRRRRYDDDEDEEDSAGEGTMGEVFDEYIEVEHWMPSGLPPLQDLPVLKENLISPVELNEGEPIQKDVTEYTGNAGMKMEYWYHYGAVFLWPRKHHYSLLSTQPVENKLEWIAYYNQQWATIDPADVSLIKKMTEHDLPVPENRQEVNADPLAEWLINLDDEKYLAREKAWPGIY